MFPYSRRAMIVLRRSLYGVVSDGRVLGLFVSLPPAVLTGFPQGANFSLEAGFGGIVFLSTVFIVFHSRYQSTLISVPPSIRPLRSQVLYPHTLLLGSTCWNIPRPIHTMWNQGPIENADVSWRCFNGCSGLLPIRRVLSPRKSGTFSFMLPYSREMMFVDISLECAVSQRPLCGTLFRLL